MAMGLLQSGCSVPLARALSSRTFATVSSTFTVPSLKKASQMESRLLLGLSEEQLQQLALDFGQKSFRGKQLYHLLYRRKVKEIQEFSQLPLAFRNDLQEAGWRVGRSPIHKAVTAADGTTKLLIKLEDNRLVETVGIPVKDNDGSFRLTACVSSQVGCPLRCSFCATGKGGFSRNLKSHEIVEQVLAIEELFKQRVTNVVFMGMGEPMLNMKEVLEAHRCLNKDILIGQRMITISTVGVPNTIKKLAFYKLQSTLALREVVRLHGIPRSILSDRDVIFLSTFWQELFRLSQTRLRMGTSYHPQSDGQTEVVNRCLESYLRCFVMEQPRTWSQYLSWAEFSFNTGFHSSTETTPFKVVYGRDPPSISPYVQGETRIAELEEQLLNRDAMLKILKDNLLKAQTRMKQQANSHRREVTFQVGDYVFLRVQPYRQRSLAYRKCEKLSPRFFGPYKIVRCVGPVAYELELPPSSKVHPIFHVSLLRPAHGQQATVPPAPFPLTEDWELVISPAKILAHRWVKGVGASSLELLVQWVDRPLEEASWENYDLIADQFPSFRLEDKATFQGGCTDTNAPLLTYSRRKSRQASGNNLS